MSRKDLEAKVEAPRTWEESGLEGAHWSCLFCPPTQAPLAVFPGKPVVSNLRPPPSLVNLHANPCKMPFSSPS